MEAPAVRVSVAVKDEADQAQEAAWRRVGHVQLAHDPGRALLGKQGDAARQAGALRYSALLYCLPLTRVPTSMTGIILQDLASTCGATAQWPGRAAGEACTSRTPRPCTSSARLGRVADVLERLGDAGHSGP